MQLTKKVSTVDRVKFLSDCLSPHNQPGDISITPSFGVMFILVMFTVDRTSKQVTEIYLIETPKGLLKNVGSLSMSSIDFTKTAKGRK